MQELSDSYSWSEMDNMLIEKDAGDRHRVSECSVTFIMRYEPPDQVKLET